MPNADPTLHSATEHILQQTVRACELTRRAVRDAGKFLLTGEAELLGRISDAEQELDVIDLTVDGELPAALAAAEPKQLRLLLVCMKFVLDLERTGDLICGFCTRAAAIHKEIRPDDLADLAQMTSLLDQMISGAIEAFTNRNIDQAMAVLRRDAEVDRLRNLLLLRNLESAEASHRHAMHIVIMAQSLERAGDHLKNLAEDVCHLVSGQTMRHAVRPQERPYEQLFIDWLKNKHATAS